jgi:hypothetical protein
MLLNVGMLYSKAFESIENTKMFSIVTLKFKDKGIQNQLYDDVTLDLLILFYYRNLSIKNIY